MKKISTLIVILMTTSVAGFAQWTTSGTNIYNSNTGYVGVGTTTPNKKFDVVSTIYDNGILAGFAKTIGTESVALNFYGYTPTATTNTYLKNTFMLYAGGASLQHLNISNAAASGDIRFLTAGWDLQTYERMLINSSGNVGIGTSTPISKLNVKEGDIRISATTTNRSLIIDAVSTQNIANVIILKRDDISRWLFGANGNGGTDDFFFLRYSNTGAFLGTPLTIQRSTGNVVFENNVGIGTSTLGSYKLAVAGKIAADDEVRVFLPGTTTFPDYVFDSDYKLPSLEETEKYVTENKHLPEVPSAKEIEKEGMSLNGMNVILLKKIEELTLYMIEMKKENDQIKKEIKELNEKQK